MARRSLLEQFTDREKATLLNYLRAGSFRVTACAAVGISSDTLRNWEKRGHAGEEPFAEFMAEVERVEALAEVETVNVIAMCARGEVPKDKDGNVIPEEQRPFKDWKAAAFILERRGAQRWAPITKNEISGKNGGPIVTGGVTPEAAAAIVRAQFGDQARRKLEEDAEEAAEPETAMKPAGA